MSVPEPECPTPRKHRHATKRGALAHLANLREARDLGPDWNAYRCPCGSWHVGHKPGSLQFRIRRALRNNRQDG